MSDELKLKPCPFCKGVTATAHQNCYVFCPECDAAGPVAFGEHAHEPWNRRPTEQQQAARIAELEYKYEISSNDVSRLFSECGALRKLRSEDQAQLNGNRARIAELESELSTLQPLAELAPELAITLCGIYNGHGHQFSIRLGQDVRSLLAKFRSIQPEKPE